jgi:hypothetical protein
MKINIFVGDRSGDGHDKKMHLTFESNFSKKQMDEAFDKGSAILGFDFTNEVATDYEDSEVPIDMWRKIKEAGYSNHIDDEESYNKLIAKPKSEIAPWERSVPNCPSVNMDEFIDIVLFICKLGAPDFEYEANTDNNDWYIGGYGLFT